MKMLMLGAASAACLTLAVAPAAAQSAPPPPPGVSQGTAPVAMSQPRHVPPVIRSPVMAMPMGPRTMSRDQVIGHVRAMFARLDANHDGYVTREEAAAFRPRMGAMHAAMARPMGGSGMAMTRNHAMDPNAMFDRLDANHDGVISRQEFMAAHARMHARAGMAGMAMHGGATRPMHGRGFGAHLFAIADADHDGRVSLQEAESAALRHFDRIDLNHDGKITPDERAQARERMRADRHRG